MSGPSKALWSKTTRIKLMIVIDTTFFLVELISGLLSHSLALTADAFHMLNDIISLVIGLWAVIASQKATTDEFTFGWVRAEILGAFFNAVFLIALCVSIILEAFTRFFEPPEIDNPKIILVVGAAGLASNLLGFLVLGGHGHAHGHGHDHDHDHDHNHSHAHAHDHAHDHAHAHAHEHNHDQDHDHDHAHHHHHDIEEGIRSIPADTPDPAGDYSPEAMLSRAAATGERSSSDAGHRHSEDSTIREATHGRPGRGRGASHSLSHSHSRGRDHRRGRSGKAGHSRFASIEDMSIHPASFRQDIIAASLAASTPGAGGPDDYDSDGSPIDSGADERDEQSPLLKRSNGVNYTYSTQKTPARRRRDSSVHDGHNHTLPRKPGAKVSGHSHADMGMNAMALHVLGDALGNIGVIATALIIWLTDWPGKYYADPAVSLFITLIILKTSIPLTIATSRVLLQATPENLSISEIREDIQRLPGVVTCHHMHVWQLSDTKIVASLHLQVSFPINTHSGEKYMQLAKRVRKCLHAYGIHSATIQPEFNLAQAGQPDEGATAAETTAAAMNLDGAGDGGGGACLIECVDDCEAQGCCTNPEASSSSSTRRGSQSSRGGASTHQH